MRCSQYLSAYLRENAKRGPGKGITPGSFLTYNLRGRAKHYAGKYRLALENSLERAGAVQGKSFGGSVAWYPKQEATR